MNNGLKRGHVWDDAKTLEALDMVERQGMTTALAAARLGVTKNGVCSLMKRVRDASDAVPCGATLPENRDGGMPERWWVRGLRVKGRVRL